MNVTHKPGDKILFICRAHCSQSEIMDAIGMSWSALFDDRDQVAYRESRKSFPAADVLRALESEALIVAVAASNMANMQALTEEDRARLMVAYQRIYSAVRMSLGEH